MADPTSILDHDDDAPFLNELRRWSNARERAQASLRSEDLRGALAPIPEPDSQTIERLRAQIPRTPIPRTLIRKSWWSRVWDANEGGNLGLGRFLQVAGCGLVAGALAFWLAKGHDGESSAPDRNDWSFEIDTPRAVAGTEASTDCVSVSAAPFSIAFRPRRTGVGEHEVRLFEEVGGRVRPLFDGDVFSTGDFVELLVDPQTDLSASAGKRILVAQIGSPGANCQPAREDPHCIRIERCIELPPLVDGSE